MKNILVTGGCGFIGSHTCLALLEKGYNLLVLDSLVNSSSNVIKKLKEFYKSQHKYTDNEITFFKGDIRNEDFLNNCFKNYIKKNKKIDAVIHFAGLKSVNESILTPLKYWDFNLRGTINLLNIMEKYDCKNLVFSSSATIYGIKNSDELIKENLEIKPVNTYGHTKAVIEQILNDLSKLKNQQWRIASLRYFNPIGAHKNGLIGESPRQNENNIIPIINKVAAGLIDELLIYGNDWETHDGTGTRDYIHVMDLADGHLLALENILNKKFKYIHLNMGTGKGTSVLELVNTFQKVNKVDIRYRFCERRKGDVPFLVADNSLARRLLNWEPKRDLNNMCEDSWNWYKSSLKIL